MSAFLEERLPVSVRMGASYEDDYNVDVTVTAGGKEYRKLIHPFPRRRFRVSYADTNSSLWSKIIALYHRAYGRFAGFRVKSIDDYTTNGLTTAPTSVDQLLGVVTAGSIYQLRKEYGVGSNGLPDIGRPFRTIFKPVANTTLVAIRNSTTGDHTQSSRWAVDTTTGRVTFTNLSKSITGITQSAAAVLTVGASHGYVVGDSVHVSGVSGMTQINGMRAAVTAIGADTITLSINSSAFSVYTSGGVVNTAPQSIEDVRGGCEFDIPCRFDSPVSVGAVTQTHRETDQIDIVELIDL